MKDAKIVDSDGFMIFEDEVVCDTCLGDVPHRKIWKSASRNSGSIFGKKEIKIMSLESRKRKQIKIKNASNKFW